MKQPSPFAFALGNRVTFSIIAGVTGLLIYLWLNDQVAWPLAFIAGAAAFSAAKAYREVQAFNAWQREWNALAGAPVAHPTKKKHWLLAMWVLILAVVMVQPIDDPTLKTAACWMFVLLSIALIAKVFWRIARWCYHARARAMAAAKSHHVVQVCLPVTRNSCSIRHITSVLPDYCQQLLRHGAKESS